MIGALAKKIFGTANDRRLKTYAPKVNAINALESQVEALTDEELKDRTRQFREELAAGKTLDDLLVPAFATVREAAKRTLGQRHFDVQLIGGMVLHEGAISEMRTGEGKTLVATLAVYLNALAGKGVHVVTVNDYLARRDAEWMGQIYRFLDMSVGVITHDLDDTQRRSQYACDITYGTNNEFGFDYLRDNMKHELADMVQFGFRLFPSAIYLIIKQTQADIGHFREMGLRASNLAVEVLQDLERQEPNANETTKTQWMLRKERLERLRDQIRDSEESDQTFQLLASLAIELQTGVQRGNTEASAVGIAADANDLIEQILSGRSKRQRDGLGAEAGQDETFGALIDQLKKATSLLGSNADPEVRRDAVAAISRLANSVAHEVLSVEQEDKGLHARAEELANRAEALTAGGDETSRTQGGHNFAIVDEVDSILIDEARTPLIISGAIDDKSDLYNTIDRLITKLNADDFELDEKQRTVHLTDAGNEHMEELLVEAGALTDGALYEAHNVTLVHHVNQALRAHKLFQKDKDYIVRNGEVVIIDEFTGRMMPGRRYSEGLHQALEAKERVQVQPENVTLASITFQNYFRLYDKLAGMTGTAATEANEFAEIYRLDVVEIPTNRDVCRLDQDDEVYRTSKEKLDAIAAEILEASARMQPMLVGTTSIEKSEQLADFLKTQGYRMIDFSKREALPQALAKLYEAARSGKPSKHFAVLNARFHEDEAYIIAEAGVPGAITIATNMAGRGTDIQLGGNVEMRINQEQSELEKTLDAYDEAARAELEKTFDVECKAKLAELERTLAAQRKAKLADLEKTFDADDKAARAEFEKTLGANDIVARADLEKTLDAECKAKFAELEKTLAAQCKAKLSELENTFEPERKAKLAELEKALDAQRKAKFAELEKKIRAEVAAFKEKAIAAGGLYIVGTERHESRRIDNQLRGRSGRQGDPGRSKFFLSLQDDLMRIFGSERMDSMLVKLGLQEGEAIVHTWINKAIEKAQHKVEARNFDIRKNILKFDNVMNDQRKVIFERRREIMNEESVEDQVADMRADVIDTMVSQHIPHDAYAEAWDVKGLAEEVKGKLNLDLPVADWAKEEGIADEEIKERLLEAADTAYGKRVEKNTEPLMRMIEKQVVLRSLDTLWREHLVALDHLRQVIGWRGMAQRDPLNEYKSEALELFKSLMTHWDETVTEQLMRVERFFEAPPSAPPELPPMEMSHPNPEALIGGGQQTALNDLNARLATADFSARGLATVGEATAAQPRDPANPGSWGKVGRNAPCPCGSGKKYKHCHGALV